MHTEWIVVFIEAIKKTALCLCLVYECLKNEVAYVAVSDQNGFGRLSFKYRMEL